MNYQFNIILTTSGDMSATSTVEAEYQADLLMDALITGSRLEEECPEITDSEKHSNGRDFQYTIVYRFKIHVDAVSIGEAEKNVHKGVYDLLQGSLLVRREFVLSHALSDEQPGLDELLEWIDDDQPFAVQEPGERYHYDCAVTIFGQVAVDREENELTVIYGREWEHEVREAFAHTEEIYSSCGHCRGSLYDAPKKEA